MLLTVSMSPLLCVPEADAAAEAGWVPPEEAEGGEQPTAEGGGAAAAGEAGGGPSAVIDVDMNEDEAGTDPARAEEQRVRHVRGRSQGNGRHKRKRHRGEAAGSQDAN